MHHSDTPLDVLVEGFLADLGTRKPSPHTLAAYRRDLTTVAELIGPLPQLTAASCTVPALRAAFARFALPRSAASVRRAWSTWNAFFGFLVTDAVVPGNPMPAVAKPRAPRHLPKPLRGEHTPEELLAAVTIEDPRARHPWPERDLAVLALALCAGLRSAELLALTVGSLAGRPGERRLDVLGKGGQPRAIPITDELDGVIESYLESRRRRFGSRSAGRGTPMFVDRHGDALRRGGMQYLVRSAFSRAGILDRVPRGASLHALRHTFATRLAEDGATAVEIMRLLGHASLATTQIYIEATAAAQRAAVLANRTNRALRSR